MKIEKWSASLKPKKSGALRKRQNSLSPVRGEGWGEGWLLIISPSPCPLPHWGRGEKARELDKLIKEGFGPRLQRQISENLAAHY